MLLLSTTQSWSHLFLRNILYEFISITFLLYYTSANVVSTLGLWETGLHYNCNRINVQVIFIQAKLWKLLIMWAHIGNLWKWCSHTPLFVRFGLHRHFCQRRPIFSAFFEWLVSISIVTYRLKCFRVKKKDFVSCKNVMY